MKAEGGRAAPGPRGSSRNLPGGVTLLQSADTLVLSFRKPREVLSTSWLNGGFCGGITAVFNHQIPEGAGMSCQLPGGDVRTYLAGVAAAHGLDPDRAVGLLTRADMKNAACAKSSFCGLTVQAVVTGGIDVNGGRAGDPASYVETGGRFEPVGGTINTVILAGAALPDYAMARALMTATEAKAAALQQVMGRSMYSTGIATGSGTDMVAVVSDPASPFRLSDAGKHSKLGEMIGRTVITSTLSALKKETGLSPQSQCDALVRLLRYRVTRADLWKAAARAGCTSPSDRKGRERYYRYLERWAKQPETVARVAAALHVVDEAEWGLLPRKAACGAVFCTLQGGFAAGGFSCTGTTPLQCVTGTLAALTWSAFQRGARAKRRQGMKNTLE